MRARALMSAAFVLAACAGPGSRPAPAPAAPVSPAPAPAPAPAAPDPFATLNLGFEELEGSQPKAWTGVQGEMAAVSDEKRGGARALRLRPQTAGARVGVAATQLPAGSLAGKHVKLRGWIKTAGVEGAALWLRVDGADRAHADSGERRLTGTQPWTEVSVELDVPPGGQLLLAGAIVNGSGTAWFDDLRLEVSEAKPAAPIVLGGTVTDAAGAPVASADVALIAAGQDIVQHVRTDAGGRFRFDARTGKWGLSAHRAGAGVGAFLDPRAYDADARELRLALGKDGGVTVAGKAAPRPPAQAYLQISAESQHDADLFAVPIEADGTFRAILPRGDKWTVSVLEGGLANTGTFERKGDRVDVALAFAPSGPPPAEVVAYIGKHGIPLSSPEAGKGFDDLAPVGKLIGRARIAALGEATHGTREFFQMKHRLLEYLVAKQGFTVFALEANQPECRAINEYVLHGKGTAKDALLGIYFWTWNTEEVLALIEWMRAWNADPAHMQKVQFVGYDMQYTAAAHANVTAFVEKVAADRAKDLLAPLALLAGKGAMQAVHQAPPEERAKLAPALAALGKAFDASRKAWTAAAGAAAYTDARHDVRILEQATELFQNRDWKASFDVRDRAMAENVGWLLEQTKAKIVVWAHNGHISNMLPPYTNMGGLLRKRYGRDYVNFGFVFGEGSFQAMDMGGARKLRDFTLGPPPEHNASVAFSRTGKPLLVLDLRALPRSGPVRDWFAAPHPVREAGSGFAGEKSATALYALPDRYDAVIYIDKTTRARPLPGPRWPG